MVSSINSSSIALLQGQTAVSILTGSSSSGTSGVLGVLASALSNSGSTTSTSAAVAPTAPWAETGGTPSSSTAVLNAVNGESIIDPSSAKLSAPAGVSTADYKNLFALYQGLNSLYDVASTAANQGTSSADPSLSYLSSTQLQTAFSSGMSQVENFLSTDPFKEFNLTSGSVKTSQSSTVGIPNGTTSGYTTGIIGVGDESQALTALQGNIAFNIQVASTSPPTVVKEPDGTTKTISTPDKNIAIDLSNMGTTPRTIDNVVNYINSQLKAQEVSTTFSAANLGTTATTTTLPNGTTSTSAGETEWGLTINSVSSEQLTFSAPNTAAAVYVSSATGGAQTYQASSTDPTTGQTTQGGFTTTATGNQLMKLQTGNDVSGAQPATITNAGNTTGLISGESFGEALPDGVSGVDASATGSDGSVYLLADASGAVNGQPIQGGSGVVLLKYDASGKLQDTQMVAGLQNATGASVAVDSSGNVAISGTNTTAAATNAAGLSTSSTTSAFVAEFDSTGNPLWSQTIPASGGQTAATGVVFGSNGQVYVSGQTSGSINGQIQHGDTDEFLQGYDSTGAAIVTQQYGTTGTNLSGGLAYDATNNTVYTAGLENGSIAVRSFALNTTTTGVGISQTSKTTATPGGTRNLGAADNIAGIGMSAAGQIVVGGTATQATIKAGTVTQKYVGVSDGFVATIPTDLTQTTGTVAYTGLSGVTQVATGMAVGGGQAYLTGYMANDPSSLASPNATEGFVTGVDTSSGAVSYSTKFPGANGQAQPTAISVSTTGSSVLDQLGLPQGVVNPTKSDTIVSGTSIQAGQSFYVRTSPGGAQTQVTVSATDTLATLATKITQALGGQGTATVSDMGATSELSITPATSSSYIELDAQQSSAQTGEATSSALQSNVLAALGLQSGVIRTVKQVNNLTDVTQLREYGLNLPTNLDISTAANAQEAANNIQAAMSAVQQAYQDLANPPTMASEAAAAAQNNSGTVPTYLTNEIANLQAGLNRLTGSDGSGSALTSDDIASALL